MSFGGETQSHGGSTGFKYLSLLRLLGDVEKPEATGAVVFVGCQMPKNTMGVVGGTGAVEFGNLLQPVFAGHEHFIG